MKRFFCSVCNDCHKSKKISATTNYAVFLSLPTTLVFLSLPTTLVFLSLFIMFCTLKKGSSTHSGVLVFNDDTNNFASPSAAHPVIMAGLMKKCILGVVKPPMFFAWKAAKTLRTMDGFLKLHEQSLVFQEVDSKDGGFQVSFADHDKANEHCKYFAQDPESRLVRVDLSALDIRKATPEEQVVGNNAMCIWLGTLIASRNRLTQAMIKSVLKNAKGEEEFGKVLIDMDSREDNQWLMWYPSPKPVCLSSWLQFLKKGKRYKFDDLHNILPLLEGFYRFTAKSLDNETRVVFHDIEIDREGVPVHVIETNEQLFISMTTPLRIDIPNASPLLQPDILQRQDTIPCFFVNCSQDVLSGDLGPIRDPRGNSKISQWDSFLRSLAVYEYKKKLDETSLSNLRFVVPNLPSCLDVGMKKHIEEKRTEPVSKDAVGPTKVKGMGAEEDQTRKEDISNSSGSEFDSPPQLDLEESAIDEEMLKMN